MAIKALDSAPLAWLLGGVRNQCVPIFMIHRLANDKLDVRGHDVTIIEQALAYLNDHGYNVVSLRDIVTRLRENIPLPSRSVVFTIDDGFADQTDQIIPIFQKFNAPVTLFVATGLLDNQAWSWDFKLDYLMHQTSANQLQDKKVLNNQKFSFPTDESRKTTLRTIRAELKKDHPDQALAIVEHIAQLLEVPLPEGAPEAFKATSWQRLKLLESELIEFAPHSVNHVVLSKLNHNEANFEITTSWQRLKEELRHPVPVFCYPTGREGLDFNRREESIAEQVGIEAAVSSDPGYILKPSSKQNLYALPRFSMPADNLSEFIKYCSWIERGRQLVTGKI